MLRKEDNEKLTRIGPGTPGGEFMRRYWQPAAMSSELPEKDGAPLRVRLLGEDLIAFRDSNGDVGLVDAYCPHRRAPMFFGRNEECGLRCVYHGWKFDRNGDCVDMPSEPAGTTLQAKVKIKAYPVHEAGGLVWAYMGPKETMPEPPDYEWMRAPETHRYVSKTFENANYLQCLEGGLDTAHSSFAHNNKLGDNTLLRARDKAPRIDVERTDYGYYYVSQRDMGEDGSYVRVYHYIMPAQQMRANTMGWFGGRNEVPRLDGHIWMPIDDHTTHVYNWNCAYDSTIEMSDAWKAKREADMGRGIDDVIPGTFRLKKNQSNDYLIDRDVQRSESYSGIYGITAQDHCVTESMGPIADRTFEHLAPADIMITRVRRLLLKSATDLATDGAAPKSATDPSVYAGMRGGQFLAPEGADWLEAWRKSMAETPLESVLAQAAE